ncbi:FtsX-like permease family protein [Lapidilactobacillus wuchangensis]|uniref:FtsX-like permease family protein n=1 Tax=Lapidilactobacillus wuchangensis TaxID=2486001 RepID=UPI000F7BA08E|nr:ABC transporter permease [Lapidilactobacillus wuchangensis]
MLSKLALSGIKSRLKDYLVLFSGLIVAAATFYMFMALATNQDFLGKNSMISAANTSFVFVFGAVLLAIITLVYLVYANSFLLNMRQRDYGMFMMLGAKTSKISQLIFMETFVLGTVATLVGSLIGTGLAQIVAQLLVQQLGLKLQHFNAFYLPAFLITIIFFITLFILAAIWNSRKLIKTPVLKLLHSADQPARMVVKTGRLAVQAILGIILLAVGYWAMSSIMQLLAIPVALVTIVLGSYFTFNATFIWIIHFLKKNKNFALKGLRNFTLSQLSFRIHDYTRMLAMISILFALALGAITVGLGFRNDMSAITSASTPYDLKLYTHNQAIDQQVAKLNTTSQATYSFKKVGQKYYYNLADFEKTPMYYMHYSGSTGEITLPKLRRYQAKDYVNAKQDSPVFDSAYRELRVDTNYEEEPSYAFVDQAKFNQVTAPIQTVTLVRVKDFVKDRDRIGQIEKLQVKAKPAYKELASNSKYASAMMATALYSGMIFMGFFLGISFLAMLASCLMFKILSGAYSDVRRYDMLNKIGTRSNVLRRSVAKEIGILYALPGALGVVHVLFGLQLFKILMVNPYHGIWLPFLIFIVLYGLYYWITVLLYRGIVIPKVEIDK